MAEEEIVPTPLPNEDIQQQSQDQDGSKDLVKSAELVEKNSPFERAVSGLAADHSRNLGGEVGARLLAAMTSHLATDNSEKKREVTELRKKVDELQIEKSKFAEENSKLKERLRSYKASNNIKTFAVFLGPTLFGFGIRFSQAGQASSAIIFCLLGAVSILFGWYLLPGEDDESKGDKK